MKLYKGSETILSGDDVVKVVMYLRPIIYEDSDFIVDFENSNVSASVYLAPDGRYHTDVNPDRRINGPLSKKGEELSSPIKDEWDSFLDDCKFLVKENGFTIIDTDRSETSKKSEYIILFGMNDNPCGSLVFDLRISDHPFDATFPEEYQDIAYEYLTINKILDGTATKAGIDFCVEGVLVGGVKHDSWDRAFYRVDLKLKQIRRRIRKRLNVRKSNNVQN